MASLGIVGVSPRLFKVTARPDPAATFPERPGEARSSVLEGIDGALNLATFTYYEVGEGKACCCRRHATEDRLGCSGSSVADPHADRDRSSRRRSDQW